jgi:hypothetical protein
MSHNFILSESEKKRIKKLYGLKTQPEYVFDFVLTENNKYLIIMDQVFVSGGDGNSIGSIWDNTHIFNELISESISKVKNLTESVQEDVMEIIGSFEWKKETINEWLKNKEIISEGVLDWIKDKANLAKDSVTKLAKWAFNGVVDMLRWIRRNAMTNIGMVIDIIVSILSVKSNAIVWLLIVLLDIYEIGTGDFDPKDSERKESPYMGLISDMISALVSSAIGFAFKKSATVVLKKGLKPTPYMVKWLTWISKKIPSMKNQLVKTANLLESKIKSGGIISKMISLIDKVLGGVVKFINDLFSKKGLKATQQAIITTGAIRAGLNYMEKNKNKNQTNTGDENSDIVNDAIKMGYLN